MNTYVATDSFEYNGETIEFNYFTRFNMSNRVAFIDAVVESVVGDDFYYPMLKDMIFDFQLMARFSDVSINDYIGDIKEMENGELLDAIEKFMNETNIGTIMKLGIDINELQILMDGVDKAIEYKTGIHPSPIADGVASILKMAEEKLSGIDLDSANAMAKVFGNMQGNITPDKMLEAYANSDVFKKMHGDAVKRQDERDKKAEDRLNVVRGNVSLDASEIQSHEDDKDAERNLELVNGLEIV